MTRGQSAHSEIRTFRASLSDSTEIDRWMEEIGTQWAIAQHAMFRARVCVAELVANAIEHGGYLAMHRGPTEKTFLDGRLEVMGEEFYLEYLRAISGRPRKRSGSAGASAG